jgi:hypothetical protein
VPFVRLLAVLDKAGLDPAGRITWACCWLRGLALDFCAPLLVGVPGPSVEALVAHELGHAFAHVRRLPRDESTANHLMVAWNFDPWQLPGGP